MVNEKNDAGMTLLQSLGYGERGDIVLSNQLDA